MKKLIISIFAVFYLGISCGFAFNIHFCMGKLSSVEFFHVSGDKCGKCGMKNMEGCCNSKLTVVKITDSQQLSSAEINISIAPAAMVPHQEYAQLQAPTHALITNFTDTSPPVSGAFLCILNSLFII